jgi:signal transduction histidine kinase
MYKDYCLEFERSIIKKLEHLDHVEKIIMYCTYHTLNIANLSTEFVKKIYSIENKYLLSPEHRTESYMYKVFVDGQNKGIFTKEKDAYNVIDNILRIDYGIASYCIISNNYDSSAGKVGGSDGVYLTSFDNFYCDLNLMLIAGIIAVCRMEFSTVLNIKSVSENLMRLAMLTITTVVSAILLILILSLARHIKKRTLIKHSVIYLVLSKSLEILIKMVASGPLMYKTMGGVLLVIIASVYAADKALLIFLISIISTYIVYKKVTHFHKIQEGLQIAKSGDYDYKIKLDGKGEFRQLSEDINELTSGLKTAVQNEVRSEKLKTELITNVSHDIKTPLTSIISYVDLLKREGLNSDNAPKYLDILERKSNRLKKLTEDLFEAAKATSGSIEPKFERVHINSLVEQLLGELDEKINEADLIFKVSASSDRIYAKADGRLLSRVMENLLSNIFKYSLTGSRVYIVISEDENYVYVSFKNISAYELNIPVNELMERFKRGDESRSSEGSGLGLAIASSLMEAQGGLLELSIDGDLFKAQIHLDKF